jgi:hypothetical protein
MLLTEPVQITRRIAQVFEDLKIQYYVGGSLASSLHGIPRATQDVDIIADIAFQHIPGLVNALEAEFYIDGDMIKEAIQRRKSFNLIHYETMFKVDIFIPKLDMAAREEMERRQQFQVSDSPQHLLYLASAEDIILNKLQWFQMGGGVSERQWNDVLGVMQIQHKKLDRSYLERAAQQRGVADLLQKVFNQFELEEKKRPGRKKSR